MKNIAISFMQFSSDPSDFRIRFHDFTGQVKNTSYQYAEFEPEGNPLDEFLRELKSDITIVKPFYAAAAAYKKLSSTKGSEEEMQSKVIDVLYTIIEG